MARFIVKIPIYVDPHSYKILETRFEVARQIYNKYLGECEKRRNKYISHADYQQAIVKFKQSKTDTEDLFKNAKTETGFYLRSNSHGRQNSLEQFTGKKDAWYEEHLDSNIRLTLMKRAYKSSDEILGKSKYNKKLKKFVPHQVKFLSANRDFIYSLEGKNNNSSIRWLIRDNKAILIWGNLRLKPIVKIDDEKHKFALDPVNHIKYVRLSRKMIKDRWQYEAQVVFDGIPPIKNGAKLGKGVSAIDDGPTTFAVGFIPIKGQPKFALGKFCEEMEKQLDETEMAVRKLQRQIDRCKRINNPNNYEPDFTTKNNNGRNVKKKGKIKKGRLNWTISKRQASLEQKLSELRRKEREQRQLLFNKTANEFRANSNEFRYEKTSKKGWQKKWGKSIGKRAPAKAIATIKTKFEMTSGKVVEIDPKSGCTCHCPNCGEHNKKELNERVHKCECGYVMQRDLSSLVNQFAVDPETNTIHAGKAKKLCKVLDSHLRTAWNESQSAIGVPRHSNFGIIPESERIARKVSSDKK